MAAAAAAGGAGAGGGGAARADGSLIAMIADEPQDSAANAAAAAAAAALQDTITGFLLAGVGNVDLRRKTNYLVVDNSAPSTRPRRALPSPPAAAAAATAATMSLSAPPGAAKARCSSAALTLARPPAAVCAETTTRAIEDSFRDFTSREDVAIVLISQYVANMIRYAIDSYSKTLPAILEIPSKEHPYDPAQDSILSRVKHMFSSDPGGSSTRGL
eukprot:SM000157S02085  [mRNA]  locus=s157:327638:328783:+ [translate_table: standard]